MFLKGKISLVTSLHLVQQHKVHINNKRTDKILLVYVCELWSTVIYECTTVGQLGSIPTLSKSIGESSGMVRACIMGLNQATL